MNVPLITENLSKHLGLDITDVAEIVMEITGGTIKVGML